ncbi:HD domain-containing protein [Asanoa sp. WMMD1127]|uniref:HD domain-containing protein n=1 Tax=Asanoa sp. WMMD1127 TaxID=3016107 RepID=UPI002416FC9F|nr:HD domain-containing protein [Asanoa sp. WMMD1127]MDG4824913.1 HD domain-containing protein [Asanoa sp. WMMD1127]
MGDIQWARDLAREVLGEVLPRRWSHCCGVGIKAEAVAHVVGDQAELLVAAAWLHDIGYAPALVRTGMHQLDGARYLRDVVGASPGLCRLIAHHTCAVIEARNRGLDEELIAEFPAVDGLLADAITYADITTSPDGEPVEARDRLSEIVARYGDGHLVTLTMQEATPVIFASVRAVEAALAHA